LWKYVIFHGQKAFFLVFFGLRGIIWIGILGLVFRGGEYLDWEYLDWDFRGGEYLDWDFRGGELWWLGEIMVMVGDFWIGIFG
jgi:hypothetical protein